MTPPTARRDPLRVGRFERRIVLAISIAAFLPLVAAVIISVFALHAAYDLAVNARLAASLEGELAVNERYHELLPAHVEYTAFALAQDPELDRLGRAGDRDALETHLCAVVETNGPARAEMPRWGLTIAGARLLGGAEGDVLGTCVADPSDPEAAANPFEAPVSSEGAADPSPPRTFSARTPSGLTLEVAARRTIDEAAQLHLAHADTFATFSVIDANHRSLIDSYVVLAAVLLFFVNVIAVAVAILLSRRVTRRILLLGEATGRVGAGDLSVQVPVDELDEVGELTRAFNAMVADLRSSRDRVEYLERVAAWQDIARRLAHEIKNPLTPIQLAVQQAQRAYPGGDARFAKTLEDTREIVDEEIQTLRRLVSEFSEFARLPEPKLEPLDLRELAEDATAALDPSALRAGPRESAPPALTAELGEEPIPVRGDAQLLRRCLDNLVRNAVHAIDDHGGTQIVVAVRRARDEAILEVRDDGPGVPDEDRERIFQPYFTTKELGTGLGLAIVKKAVLEHGGSIECRRAPEGGAAFSVRLPIAPVEPTQGS